MVEHLIHLGLGCSRRVKYLRIPIMQAATRLRMQWSCQVSQDSHHASCHLSPHAMVVSSLSGFPSCKLPPVSACSGRVKSLRIPIQQAATYSCMQWSCQVCKILTHAHTARCL